MKNKIYFGRLIKEESLKLLTDKVLPNTYVLEANDPFPGYFKYHHEVPAEGRPHYLYYVLESPLKLEKFTRITQDIKSRSKHPFSAALGSVEINNKIEPAIRVRRLGNYNQIEPLQAAYAQEQIEFKKKPLQNIAGNAMIHLDKFYSFSEEADGKYLDAHEKDIGYFEMPKHLNWKTFFDLTQKVRNNVRILDFDASKGLFYKDYKTVDLVRIYSHNMDMEKLQELQEAYLERMK